MKKYLFYLCVFFALLVAVLPAHGQLSFPKGTTLNLNTGSSVLYFETEILFHTGKFNVNNYDWVKVSDSIDARWAVSSCFNGDCWNDLPAQSSFIKDYGYNDTTGFIRFHVDTRELDGKSVIHYEVVNRSDVNDRALLTFNISYTKTVSIANLKTAALIAFQSADLNFLQIKNMPLNPHSAGIYNPAGKQILFYLNPSAEIFTGNLAAGLYILEIKTDRQTYRGKFIIR